MCKQRVLEMDNKADIGQPSFQLAVLLVIVMIEGVQSVPVEGGGGAGISWEDQGGF